MDSYFCIVNLPDAPVRDIHVLAATEDGEAIAGLTELAHHWASYKSLELYHGERLVTVTVNPVRERSAAGAGAARGEVRFAPAAWTDVDERRPRS